MNRWIALIMALTCAFSLVGCSNQSAGKENKALISYRISAPEYPKMAKYPDETAYFSNVTGEFDDESFDKVYTAWWEDHMAQRDQPEGYADGLDSFFAQSIQQVLSCNDGENKLYSPLSVYLALAMLAEATDGNSRRQILDLLGADSIDSLRTQARSVWNANYCDDGAVTSILASSLWLNNKVNFIQETMNSLAEYYYASSFKGEMGSTEFNQALWSWINEQTGELLKNQASGLEFDPDTIMAIATTIYFRAKWSNEFSESRTEQDVFYAPNGELTCDFMHQSGTRTYYWGDQFSAVQQSLEGSGGMWFILPDEGITPEELLEADQVMEFLFFDTEWENNKFLVVNLAVPKFDIVSDMDLISGLQKLGITDVFDMTASDFSPLTSDTEDIYVSQVRHAARVTIDEEGCTAAAYTVMAAAGAAMPPDEEVDFVLDRPFIFIITGQDNLPLFAGIVNQPA